MSLIAEFTLNTPILVEARRAVPSVDFKVEDEFVSIEGTPFLTAWAMGDNSDLTTFHEAIGADSTVSTACLLAEMDDRRLYRLELSPEGAAGMTYPAAVDEGLTFLEISGSGETVRYRVRVPDRESLTAYRRLCADRDLEFRLLGLYQDESRSVEPAAVTERQREVLRAAFEAGYFAVPRQTTLESLAADFDISEQALSAIIRRGESNLLAETVASDLSPMGAAEDA
ncbi:helix-turn-helix domain-containing protein [Halovivax asiaticus]|nr:helix-turn-helix domain-containing protein [Halovivax asiaticus]